MHVRIVEFELQGVGRRDYEARCEQIAPAFAAVPGLLSKVWIAEAEGDRAGGVYTWADPAACDAYLEGELVTALAADPALGDVRMRRFEVLARPTEVTRGPALPAVA